MLKNHSKSKSGFTIIEVVLVLAIAGLIFLMVFLALPALQRSQRDTQRRDDLSGFSTQITNYQSNNRGKVPSSTGIDTKVNGNGWGAFLKNYMRQLPEDSINIPDTEGEGEFIDPDGTNYIINDKGDYTNYTAPTDFDHTIYVYHKGKCEGENVVEATGSNRQLAFVYKLEGGGVFCGSNS
ncbi:type II secretion system protein [Candidatus Saccharibacteria bacterium]|nr:type II secretion system protein [Candidatus Saccharibacteria bacterium]